MNFTQRLKELRLSRGLTQEQLGDKISVTKVSISGYENGNRNPDMETLQRIADYFNVSVDYLLGRSNLVKEEKAPYTVDEDKSVSKDDPSEAFGQWVRMRAKKGDFTPDELTKLEKRVRNILKELDEEHF